MADDLHASVRSALTNRLRASYPQADPTMIVRAVVLAQSGLETMQLSDDSAAMELLAVVAERELRLRLQLDGEDARLARHAHRGATDR